MTMKIGRSRRRRCQRAAWCITFDLCEPCWLTGFGHPVAPFASQNREVSVAPVVAHPGASSVQLIGAWSVYVKVSGKARSR